VPAENISHGHPQPTAGYFLREVLQMPVSVGRESTGFAPISPPSGSARFPLAPRFQFYF